MYAITLFVAIPLIQTYYTYGIYIIIRKHLVQVHQYNDTHSPTLTQTTTHMYNIYIYMYNLSNISESDPNLHCIRHTIEKEFNSIQYHWFVYYLFFHGDLLYMDKAPVHSDLIGSPY